MKRRITNCYCDILSEHNGQKIEGAKTYNKLSVLVEKPNEENKIEEVTLDMCDACRNKYAPNMFAKYPLESSPVYYFKDNPPVTFKGTKWLFYSEISISSEWFVRKRGTNEPIIKTEDNQSWYGIKASTQYSHGLSYRISDSGGGGWSEFYDGSRNRWADEKYKPITFIDEPDYYDGINPIGLYNWLKANALQMIPVKGTT